MIAFTLLFSFALAVPVDRSGEYTTGRCFTTYAYLSHHDAANETEYMASDWKANVQCALVERETDDSQESMRFLNVTAQTLLRMDLDELERTRFLSRTALFHGTPEVWDRVRVELQWNATTRTVAPLGRTNAQGQAESEIVLANADVLSLFHEQGLQSRIGMQLQMESPTPDASILFTYPAGFGIFSDIDDTLRQSHVSNGLKLLQSTFLDHWTPVPGMPDLFRHMQTILASSSTPPTTVYVSASPWQLVDHLKAFTQTYYATGELMLAPFVFYSPVAFMQMKDPTDYKMDRFAQLHDRFPQKRWYLIGDSSQHDPEIYAQIYEKYGGNAVACIWILQASDADVKQNEQRRFEKAFAKVPTVQWLVFQDPMTLLNLSAGQCR